jgi:thymidylate kinase
MEELMVGARRRMTKVEERRREKEVRGLKKKEGVRKCYLKFIKQLKDKTRVESTRCLYNLCCNIVTLYSRVKSTVDTSNINSRREK